MINAAPKTTTTPPITTNCIYLGLETNTRQIAMPKIMMAVLRFSEATITTMGMTSSMTLTRAENLPICLGILLMTVARKMIIATFAISDGWKLSGPNFSQRLAPLSSCPTKRTSVHRPNAVTYARNQKLFHTR